MNAQPLRADLISAASPDVERRFWEDLREFESRYVDLGLSIDYEIPVVGELSTWRRRWQNVRAAERGRLDEPSGRLYRFMHRVVDSSERFSSERDAALKDLIQRNCTFLLVGAVAETPELFSRRFRRALERRWPFRFSSMRRLEIRARERLGQAVEILRQRQDVGSPFELL